MIDPNKIAKLEQAIGKKYGEKTIVNVKSLWSEEDEREYQKSKANQVSLQDQSIEISGSSGIIITSKLIRKDERVCSKCGTYSFFVGDDLYLSKFGICYRCFLHDEFVLKNKGLIK